MIRSRSIGSTTRGGGDVGGTEEVIVLVFEPLVEDLFEVTLLLGAREDVPTDRVPVQRGYLVQPQNEAPTACPRRATRFNIGDPHLGQVGEVTTPS